MERTVCKWGNSLGVRIPQPLAKMAGIEIGTHVRIDVEKGRLIIEPEHYDLEVMLKDVTEENKHQAIETGAPLGREVW